MPPTPTPTEVQIETVREMAEKYSFEEVEAAINELNDSAWAATISDITEFDKVKNKFYRTSAEIPVEYERKRQALKKRVCERLQLIAPEEGRQSKTVPINFTW